MRPTTCKEYVLTIGSYDSLRTREIEVPQPGATEVLVKVHAVSLQYRDLAIAAGTYAFSPLPKELVPCSDMAGEVVEVGDRVEQWKVGDRVCGNFFTDHIYGDVDERKCGTALGGAIDGVLAKYKVLPAHSLVRIPNHLTYEEASTLPCATLTAYNALNGPVPVKAGDTVLVLGTGGVSIAGLQLARAAGATVIATSSSDDKLAMAKKLGAKYVINYKKTPNWGEEVQKLTNGVGVDHVIEVGGIGTIEQSMKAARMAGWLHLVGFLGGKESKQINFVVDTMKKALTLRSVLIGSVTLFNDLVRTLEANPEATKPVVDKVFSFNDAIKAYQHLESQKHVGKVVIKVA
ncbi:hypothetical protein AX16_006612 [Volvariella volvacea WC 439]|nr:hypothetical protein AX16_006612 [Volvariella volvacea WC 439]